MGSAKIWVPLDDEHTLIWEPSWSLSRHSVAEADRMAARGGAEGGSAGNHRPLSRWVFAENADNDYGLDRQRQKTVNYTGMDESNPLQDGAIQETMGGFWTAPSSTWARPTP